MNKELFGICIFDWLIYLLFCAVGVSIALIVSFSLDLNLMFKIGLPIFIFIATLILFLFARGLGGPNNDGKKPMITN